MPRGFLGEVDQWDSYLGEVLDKAAVEIAETKEEAQVSERSRLGSLAYSVDLLGVDADAIFADDVSHKLDLFLEELTLARFAV